MVKLPSWPNPSNLHNINLGLERIFELLKRLDNPHLKLPPTIHIAGTNGKGSTLAFLKNIYENANYRVHRYTSPHLIEFNERIELAGVKISDEFLDKLLNECRKACEKTPKIDVTFFEATTACALLAFSLVEADILLLETGMGGEFDATNILSQVFQTIITPISFDHQDFLGTTLEEIAKAKAGIIKKNCPVICAKQHQLAQRVIDLRALELNSLLIKSADFCQKLNFDFASLQIPLFGTHQIENCQTAITAVKSQNLFQISDANIKDGIANTSWKARLEKINHGYFIQKLAKNFQLFLDGSHNPQGATTIHEFLSNYPNHRKIIIFQMLEDKNCQEFLKIISSQIDKLFTYSIVSNTRFRKAQEILKLCQAQQINAEILANFDNIFTKISAEFFNQKTIILICGSLYFASEFLNQNHP